MVFFCDPVGIESICYRMRANCLINESNTNRGLKKIWTGLATNIYASQLHAQSDRQ